MKSEMPKKMRLAWRIKDIHHQHANLTQIVLNSLGLHFGQPRILFTIRDLEGASQKEIAERLQVTPASLAMSLKRLQRGGFLERSVGIEDQRVNKIQLTAKGLQTLEFCSLKMHWIDQQMLTGFSELEKNQLNDYLTRIGDNLAACRIEDCQIVDEAQPDIK